MAATANGSADGDRRTPSTPYARRLARERGVELSAIVGSGPRGRITGDDVLAFTPKPATPEPTPRLTAATSAIATSVDLTASRDLLVQFGDRAPSIGMIDIILKSTAASLRAAPEFATDSGRTLIGLAAGGTLQVLAGVERLTLSAVAALREEAVAPPDKLASLTISWLERDGIRPVVMSLETGAAARLVVAAGPASTRAECLLSYDPQRIDDFIAADLLLAFKGAMEFPLRLIA